MLWKPALAGIAVLAVSGSTAGLWWRWFESPTELRLPGTVETQDVRLSSRVGGRVVEVFVRESQLVEPGQKIVALEMPELDAQRSQLVAQKQAAEAVLAKLKEGARKEELAAAKAAVDAAAARLARMESGYRQEEVEQARQEIQSLQAQHELAKQDYQRELALRDTRASSKAQYDAAVAQRDKIESQVNAAKARLQMLEKGFRVEEVAESRADLARLQALYDLLLAGTRPEEIDEQAAKVADLEAKIAELDVKRNERIVVAAERSIVEVLMVRPGDIAAPNQPVALMQRADDLWVKAFISEIDLGKIQLGQQVTVTCDAYPQQRFQGEITYIAAAAEFTPRNVQTIDERRHQVFGFKVRVDDPSGVFKSGMAADVWLPLVGH